MTDQLEQDLARLLHARAESTDVPQPSVDLLVREGERAAASRRRRVGLVAAVAAAALVVAVALAVGVRGDEGSAPSPATPSPSRPSGHSLAELPRGAPPRVPYLQGGALHVGTLTIPTKADTVVAAGDTVLVSRWHDDTTSWWVLRDGALAPAPYLQDAQQNQISPDGSLAVARSWPDKMHTRLTALDPATGGVIGQPLMLDAPYADCCGGGQEVIVHGIDATGAVYFSDHRGLSVWRPGAWGPTLWRRDRPADVTPAGAVFDSTLLAWTPEGVSAWHISQSRGFAMSSDGSLIAYGNDYLERATGRFTPLLVPADAVGFEPVGFENDDAVLLAGPPPHGGATVVIRCRVDTGRCERVGGLDNANAVAGLRY